MKHQLGRRLEDLPSSLYPVFRRAAISMADEIARKMDAGGVTENVWTGMRQNRLINMYLLVALEELTGAKLAELLDPEYEFDAAEVSRRVQEYVKPYKFL
ncbi:MAG: hypothetical protein SF052_15810 [Bacteroidia bacterium]|nr:hypothetical protein [Bacteroidia bacterium]